MSGPTPTPTRSTKEDELRKLQQLQEVRRYRWHLHARPKQMEPPGSWFTWLILAGRGFGKTRTGAEWIRLRQETGKYGRFALVGEDMPDVRDVMVQGESGILATSPRWNRPKYIANRRRLEWANGAYAILYSGDDPESLRGPQHDTAWFDELAKCRYQNACWDNLQMGLRLGPDPRTVVTTTPKPTPLILRLVKEEVKAGTVHLTTGATHENLDNLAPTFRRQILQYEGTRLGRQELYAEVLEDVEGALWTSQLIERLRIRPGALPELERVVVAIDPAVSAGEGSAETGIIVAGRGMCRCKVKDGKGEAEMHGFVLEDRSGIYRPAQWANEAVGAYEEWAADKIIGEANNGGDLVERNIRVVEGGRSLAFKAVHASRGKYTRAEPISNLYEQGKVHHVGLHPQLEDQMCKWVQGEPSPDRLDGLVWALWELLQQKRMLKAG